MINQVFTFIPCHRKFSQSEYKKLNLPIVRCAYVALIVLAAVLA